MTVTMEPSWHEQLQEEFSKPYFQNLVDFVKSEYQKHSCYPPGKKIFSAFDHTPFNEVKVVIIGQDPYHGPNQATGLSFANPNRLKAQPSLLNIFRLRHIVLFLNIYILHLTCWFNWIL